jgi:hypothetical protein
MVAISAIDVLFSDHPKCLDFDFHIFIWPDDFEWKSIAPNKKIGYSSPKNTVSTLFIS